MTGLPTATAGVVVRLDMPSRQLVSIRLLRRKPHFASIALWHFLGPWGNRGTAATGLRSCPGMRRIVLVDPELSLVELSA